MRPNDQLTSQALPARVVSMAQRFGSLFVALTAATLTGCTFIPPTGPAEITTRQGADGLVRQFALTPQSSGQLSLGTAKKLLFAVSSGQTVQRAESFRIQAQATGPLAPDAPPPEAAQDPHGRFRASSQLLLAEAPSKPAYRLQAAPSAEGDVQEFWVNSGTSTLAGDHKQKATNQRVTPHAYFFVDHESTLISDATLKSKIDSLAAAFEDVIYPNVTRFYGSPPDPGIDGDPRVYVVLSPAVDNFGKDRGLMGYFWSRDVLSALPGSSSPRANSNQKEVIFLTDKIFQQKPWTTFGTLAHEFTHLVVFNQKVIAPGRTTPEETWLDEALAMLAMDLCGWGLRNGNDEIARDIASFQEKPDQYSLTDWFRNPRGFSYGLSYLFARYLYDRFNEGIFKDVMASPQIGISGVDQALARRGVTFQDCFSDWSLANAISGLNLTRDPRYSYAPEINLRGTYGAIQLKGIQPRPLDGPSDVSGPSRPWGSAYYFLGSPQERTWKMDVPLGLSLFGGTVTLER